MVYDLYTDDILHIMLSIKVAIVVYQTVIGIFAIGVLCGNCENGWIPHNNRCYNFSQDTKNQTEVITACEDMEGVLASAANIDVNDFLWNSKPPIPGEPFYWIGLVSESSDWYWNDGSKADSVVVDNSNPNSVCVQVSQGSKLSSIPCTRSRWYICQSNVMRTNWKEYGGMWYYISNHHQDYVVTNMIAMEKCRNMTSILAMITDVTGLSVNGDTGSYWISLSKLHWLDGSPYYWHNWWTNEPGPVGGQPCVLMHPTQNKWYGDIEYCSQQHRYICQKDFEISTKRTTSMTTATIATTPTTLPTAASSVYITSELEYTTTSEQNKTLSSSGENKASLNTAVPLKKDETVQLKSQVIGLSVGLAMLAFVCIALATTLVCIMHRSRKKNEQSHTIANTVTSGGTNGLSGPVNYEMSAARHTQNDIPYEDIDNVAAVREEHHNTQEANTYERVENSHQAQNESTSGTVEYQSLTRS